MEAETLKKEDFAMTNVTKQRSVLGFLMLAAAILLIDTTLVRTLPSADNDHVLAYAVIFDFALVIPLLYWWLVARRKGKPVWKAAPFTGLGAVVAWLVLPAALKSRAFEVMWPLELSIVAFEVALIGYEIRLLYRFIGRLRRVRRIEPETSEALRIAIREEFGDSKLAAFVLHDASLVYFLFFSWRRRAKTETAEPGYTYHRQTSLILYAGIITHMIVFEAAILHLLVQMWSTWAAWALTALDVWLLALLWADCRASALRPVRLSGGTSGFDTAFAFRRTFRSRRSRRLLRIRRSSRTPPNRGASRCRFSARRTCASGSIARLW